MNEEYDPLSSPFDMPVGIFAARCRPERPILFGARSGADFRTTLRGAYGRALVHLGCQRARGSDTCLQRSGRTGCVQPDTCPLPWLHEPHIVAQKRDHPSPIVLRVTDVQPWESDRGELGLGPFELLMVLLGRHALEHESLAFHALERAGVRGVFDQPDAAARRAMRGPPDRQGDSEPPEARSSVPFSADIEPVFRGSLRAWVAERLPSRTRAVFPREVLLELATPLAANPPDFGALLGNLAHDLVQWDLADCGLADEHRQAAKRWCDQHAERARAEVAAALQEVTISGALEHESLGRRFSRSNRGRFALEGFTGWLSLKGNLERVLPWLVALELRGGGKKKTFGMGEVRLGLADSE